MTGKCKRQAFCVRVAVVGGDKVKRNIPSSQIFHVDTQWGTVYLGNAKMFAEKGGRGREKNRVWKTVPPPMSCVFLHAHP